MQRLVVLAFLCSVFGSGCHKESTADNPQAEDQAAVSPVDSKVPSVEVKTPVTKAPLVTCDSLGIPSYEGLIRELTALRCESCHGDKLSFNGVKLLSYQDYQTYGARAKIRIETNMLTKPLDPIEQGLFLTWFEKGMPRTEKDCENKN